MQYPYWYVHAWSIYRSLGMHVRNACPEVLSVELNTTRLSVMLIANPQSLITAYEALMNCDRELRSLNLHPFIQHWRLGSV